VQAESGFTVKNKYSGSRSRSYNHRNGIGLSL